MKPRTMVLTTAMIKQLNLKRKRKQNPKNGGAALATPSRKSLIAEIKNPARNKHAIFFIKNESIGGVKNNRRVSARGTDD